MFNFLVFYNFERGIFDSISIGFVLFLQLILLTTSILAVMFIEPLWAGLGILIFQIGLANVYFFKYNVYTIAKNGYKFMGTSKAWRGTTAINNCKLRYKL